ncbi:MAG TPA: DUF2723 domain-containing protein, partial [Patescibacteria group bacterium]|nr:DUF2723 domain-containing protein [Patescibacteria group bacterium]
MSVVWLISILSFAIFLTLQAKGIYAGDSGDLVTAAALMGVPHPPGYPLYTFFGFLLSKLPFYTISWRVTLLSSLPHAITVGLVYGLVFRATKRRLPGIFSSLLLLSTYLYTLYSITPEVFALLDLFVVLLFTFVLIWYETKQGRYLTWATFVFGLSLTHHHMILFLVPAAVFLILRGIKRRGIRLAPLWKYVALFLLGLLPYLYAPIAGRGDAILNWDRPVDAAGFFRLITRADYGTFVSGPSFGTSLGERLVSLKAVFRFIWIDFTWIGLPLIAAGVWGVFKKGRDIGIYWVLAGGLLGPIFLAYASFPLANTFTLGTYERFLLPLYVLLIALAGIGFSQCQSWVAYGASRYLGKKYVILSLGFSLVLFFYPIFSGYVTWKETKGIREDRTAEYLAADVLATLPQGAVVILARDTVLFTTQYVRYALDKRP